MNGLTSGTHEDDTSNSGVGQKAQVLFQRFQVQVFIVLEESRDRDVDAVTKSLRRHDCNRRKRIDTKMF
jgi:hypothetical protein